jgi:hypothetical protein
VISSNAPAAVAGGSVTVADVPTYQSDAIVRRATSLQRTREARIARQVFGAGGQS